MKTENLLPIKGVASMLGITRPTIYRRVKAGLLPPAVPMGPRANFWPQSELIRIIEVHVATRHNETAIRATVEKIIAEREALRLQILGGFND